MQPVPRQGSITEVFLPRLVAQLHRDGFEGALRVQDGTVSRAIYFKGGEIASAASNAEEDRLQNILIEDSRLTTAQVEVARARSQSGTSLGKILIEMGLLTPSELLQCARRQVRQILASTFTLKEGTYQVDAGPLPAQVTVLGLRTKRLVFDSLLHACQRQWIVQEMGSMESVYRQTSGLAPGLRALKLEPEMAQIARTIDGTLSLRQLSSRTSMDDFTVGKVILALEVLGLVERAGEPIAGASESHRIIPIETEPPPIPPRTPAPEGQRPDLGASPPDAAPVDDSLQPAPPPEPPAPVADAAAAPIQPGAGGPPSEGEGSEADVETPSFPPSELPAFAVPPGQEPEWTLDPATGERVHVGPIELTFGGRISDEPARPSRLTPYLAVVLSMVIIVLGAYFYFSREAAPVETRAVPPSAPEPIAQRNLPDLPDGSQVPPNPSPAATDAPPPESTSLQEEPPPSAQKEPVPDPVRTDPIPEPTASGPDEVAHPDGGSASPRATTGPSVEPPSPRPPGNLPTREKPREAPPAPSPDTPAATPGAGPTRSPFRSASAYATALHHLDSGEIDEAAALFSRLVVDEGGEGFTLQVMIACQAETVSNARASAGESGPLFVLPFTFKGRDCYRICWGNYPSMAAAQQDKATLPTVFLSGGTKPVVVSMPRLRRAP